jgi:hypothetical protein
MKIRINEKEYPLYVTMGALLRYKRETGRDAGELKGDSLEDVLMLMWCCVVCASQAHNIEFPLDFETFCNSITPKQVNDWAAQSTKEQKKTVPKPERPAEAKE